MTINDLIYKLKQTPAINKKRDIIRNGNISFVLDLEIEQALSEIKIIRKRWTKIINYYFDVLHGKKDLEGIDLDYYYHRQGKLLRIITHQEWVEKYGIPDAERYLLSLNETEQAISYLYKKLEIN